MIDIILDMTSIYDKPTPKTDCDSLAVIHHDNGMVLYYCLVNRYFGLTSQLALVCLIRKEQFEKQGLIDFNFKTISEAILQVCEQEK